MHEKYIEFVKKGFVEDIYGHALSHAKDRREVADYDIEKIIGEEEAESILADVNQKVFMDKGGFKEFYGWQEGKDFAVYIYLRNNKLSLLNLWVHYQRTLRCFCH